MAKVNLDKVWKLYRKVVSVEEFRHPVKKWTSILDDGSDVKSNDDMKYHRLGLEGVVQACIDSGATHIQFLCRDENKKACYPDYKIEELIEK